MLVPLLVVVAMGLGVCLEALIRGAWLLFWWFQQRAKEVFRRGWFKVRWYWDGVTWTTWRPRRDRRDKIPPEKRKRSAA